MFKKATLFFIIILNTINVFSENNINVKIKALFIYKLTQLVNYPNFEELKSIKIGLFKVDQTLANELSNILKGKQILNKPVEFVLINKINDINKIQSLFIPYEYTDSIVQIENMIGNYPTLTIGDNLPSGLTMFNLIVRENKIYFEVNNDRTGEKLIHINSTLDKLGVNVIEYKNDYKEVVSEIENRLNSDNKTIFNITRNKLNLLIQKIKEFENIKSSSDKKIKEHKKTDEIKSSFIFYAIIILAIVIIFSLIIFQSYLSKKSFINQLNQQKKIIHSQKLEVEYKNKEILDSIKYAKRLQSAILPPLKIVKEYLQNSFILYKPKDIVAGDFYFFETINNKIIVAAADCTGHGVPGAMVSVVCSNALKRSVNEFNLTHPGEILDKVSGLVLDTFSLSEEKVKDGMDISICSIDLNANLLEWAGANNGLWIIRDKELIELKPNKQPIGYSLTKDKFENHSFNLNSGDSIYLYTDGFADQFGGDKGKKFKSLNMKNMFLDINDLSMDQQSQEIDQIFEKWKGDLEQVDDVCIIGIKI